MAVEQEEDEQTLQVARNVLHLQLAQLFETLARQDPFSQGVLAEAKNTHIRHVLHTVLVSLVDPELLYLILVQVEIDQAGQVAEVIQMLQLIPAQDDALQQWVALEALQALNFVARQVEPLELPHVADIA